jgi:hypothetical protein
LILESNDPFVEVQQDSVFVGGVKSGQKVAPAESFVLFVKPDCPCPHDAQMTLNMKNDKGYTNSRNINFRSGHSSLLLVDDDAGSDYEKYFIDALDMLSVDYDLWDRNSLGRIGAYGTLNYKKMIWFTGDSKENTLDENDRIDIETFFNKNGLLILTGQDIGHEIGFLSFYRNFLHAGLIRDDENKYVVEGDAEDPVFKDFVFPIIGHGGANNQKSPSSINAIEGAKVFLNYVEGEGAGIAYKGSYTLFYLSFGLEAIPSLEVRTSVLGLMLGVKGIENPGKRPPAAKTSTHLSQNYPNPFNPVTTIDFTSSQRGMVSIKIYNIKGELVKILLEKILEQGNYSVQWDGFNQYNEPCSSGIYFYKMSAGKCDYNRKMLLLK